MTEISPRETAKIYRFPPGGRAAAGGRRSAERIDDLAQRMPRAGLGSSWYHEAAIADAEQERKR